MGDKEDPENGEFFRALVENSSEISTMFDKEGKVLYRSPAYERILGYARDDSEFIGVNRVNPDDRKRLDDVFKESYKNPGIPFFTSCSVKAKSGNDIYLEGYVINMLDVKGVNAFVTTYNNVTKFKKAEEELIKAKERFSSLVNTVHGIVWEADIEPFRSTFISKQAEEILGHSIKRWLNEPDFWENHIHPDDKQRVISNYIKYPAENKTYEFEYRMFAEDGRIVWFKDIVTAVFDDHKPKYLKGIMIDITKQKKAEEDLAKTRENFSSLVNTIKGIVWEANAETFEFSFVSKQAEEILGYPSEQWINEPDFWKNHIHPDDREWAVDYCVSSTKQKKSHDFEYRMIAADGAIVWLQDIVTVIVENDKPTYLRGIMVDISERMQALEDLAIREHYFKNLIAQSASAIILISPEGKFLYQSPVVEKIVGYTIEDESYTNVFQFIHPDEKDEFQRLFLKLMNEPGGTVKGEFRFLHKDGHYVWLEGTVTNLLHDKNINALIANYQDVTERKKAKDALEKSDANLHTIFDNADTGYILMDPNLTMVLFNNPAIKFSEENLGKTLVEGTNAIDYFPEQRQGFMRKKMNEALAGQTINHEVTYPQSDGSNRWYFMRFYPVYNLDKKLFGVVMALTDITERKLSELQRKKITYDLLQRNKAQEQFTYIVSHNLRSPVAHIIGVSKLLQEGDLSPEDRDLIMEGLAASAKKLDEVIVDLNQILQVKRDVRENKEMVKFAGVVKDIELTIGEWIKNEEVKIVTDFSEFEEMLTLKSYLNSIFYNLISNSVKYRRTGIPSVIEIKSSKKGGKLQLSFKDNGMGIDLEKKGGEVFGLYKRFHTFVEGRGLGLYMVKTQVETLGGKIGLSSKVNEGTEFIIDFEQ